MLTKALLENLTHLPTDLLPIIRDYWGYEVRPARSCYLRAIQNYDECYIGYVDDRIIVLRQHSQMGSMISLFNVSEPKPEEQLLPFHERSLSRSKSPWGNVVFDRDEIHILDDNYIETYNLEGQLVAYNEIDSSILDATLSKQGEWWVEISGYLVNLGKLDRFDLMEIDGYTNGIAVNATTIYYTIDMELILIPRTDSKQKKAIPVSDGQRFGKPWVTQHYLYLTQHIGDRKNGQLEIRTLTGDLISSLPITGELTAVHENCCFIFDNQSHLQEYIVFTLY